MLSLLLCLSRVGCMCSLCWTTLQQEHQFSLECLLKPLASHGSMVRKMHKRDEEGKRDDSCFHGPQSWCYIRCLMRNLLWRRSSVPHHNMPLLDTRILQLEAHSLLMVLASSFSVHIGVQWLYCSCGAQEPSAGEWLWVLTAACGTYSHVHSSVVRHHMKTGNRSLVLSCTQSSNSSNCRLLWRTDR